MPLEQINYSQVVTLDPQQPQWQFPVLSAGVSAGSSVWAGPFTNSSFIVAGSLATGQPLFQPGDKFQLYTGATLKEPTVFHVTGTTPSAGFSAWNLFYSPAPQVLPTTADTILSIPAPKNPRWLGVLGHVSGLSRTYKVPGGPDTLTLLLRLPADYRTDALNPGRVVQAWRGASCVWEGKLGEASPGADGWTVTANGAGNYGEDFTSIWVSGFTPDEIVNRAVGRGLRWDNRAGLGSPAGTYLSQPTDSGSQTVTASLNLMISGGGLIWKVTRGAASTVPAGPWAIEILPWPTDANGNPQQKPDRLLVCNSPVARTIAADINQIVFRYMVSADITSKTGKTTPATYANWTVTNAASVAKHGPMEYYLDVTSAGVITTEALNTIGNNILSRYVRASFAGPFTAGPGQVLNAAGQPADMGCDEAGLVYQVILTDAPFGGEVAAAPLVFMSGAYSFDEDTGTATITPYQGVRTDMAGLISALYPEKF